MHVLVIDSPGFNNSKYTNIAWYNLSDVNGLNPASTIIAKYADSKDKIRWSLKPVFIKSLLQTTCDKMIYTDNDMFFFGNPSFLFDLLNIHSVLLTPHHYKRDPKNDQNWFEANFRVGLYNAGFIAANKHAVNAMQWWAECCAYRCEKNALRGLFDDQKYLDLMPIEEPGCHILEHRGCNVAGWNKELCKRELVDGTLLISGEYPLIFVHFNDTTIREIIKGDDALLLPYYNSYFEMLKVHKADLTEDELLFHMPLSDKIKFGIWKVITDFGI